ncbi:unnamed protein product [Ambrosiozyma monospora]|uniref:Unnamed protein product n=1 Tax=Ambrosiozyma monospora TaxID=43982 RepID=A0ACB5TU29_AMBMO|nr:unnamed protein product [Ambrosiozyma monospora]
MLKIGRLIRAQQLTLSKSVVLPSPLIIQRLQPSPYLRYFHTNSPCFNQPNSKDTNESKQSSESDKSETAEKVSTKSTSTEPSSTKKIIPPSVKDAQPIRTNKRVTQEEVISAIQSGNYEMAKHPLWLKFLIFTMPIVLFLGGYVVYNTSQGKPVFLPIWFGKSVPLEKAKGIDEIDLENLKDATKEILLRRLSMNTQIRLKFGLPLQLREFQKFDVNIELLICHLISMDYWSH